MNSAILKRNVPLLGLLAAGLTALPAQVPDNLVVEGIPPIPPELRNEVGRYLEFRGAGFNSWHPLRREMLITTRFADAAQLHWVRQPGGARKQITFLPEPVAGGSFHPVTGEFIVFSQDTGGGEFYQFYRFDPADGKMTLLTDGKSRNTGARWSKDGKWLAYSSTRRTGRDTDIWVMNPAAPKDNRLLIELAGGGWGVADWSADNSKLLLYEYVSINESYLHVADAKTGARELLTPKGGEKISYGPARFARDGKSVFVTTDAGSEFRQLVQMDLKLRPVQTNLKIREWKRLTAHIPWNVDEFEISHDGKTLAFVTNEDGVGVLRLLDTATGKERRGPKLPLGTLSRLEWHPQRSELAFNLSSARSPFDVYAFQLKSGQVERWTESETGGLDPERFVEPDLVKMKSFDGLGISAFVYRPDPARFPGKRPVLVSIHGGPESQSRPGFQARNNYYLNELGIALVVPNVRGSAGYGKTFLTLDNGYRREDSVRDIGAVLDWIGQQADLDGERVGVMGGSYGGYMVLASMVHFNDRLRCGIDVVGISNFVTFLENTQDYRRDLRRVEYGDERDPPMRAFLEKISPNNNVDKIKKPLLVVQGKNDPRVPLSEAEQMVKAIRDHGGTVWYLMAKDEGHGFARKSNADYQFLSMILFLREFLLN